MRDILRAIHTRRYVTTNDFPQIADPEVRRELAVAADAAGLRFSYDPTTASATLIVDADDAEPAYGPLERATILVTWLLLVFRRKERLAVDQPDKWERLTPEAQTRHQASFEISVTASRISTAFPNLYPLAEKHATPQLNKLVKRGLLTIRREEGVDHYMATPLLAHIVDEERAYSLVTGHLRGEFEHLLFAAQSARSLEDELRTLIASLPEGDATMEVFQHRLRATRNDISAALDALKEAHLIRHEFGKARGGYWLIATETESDREEVPE